MTLESQKPQQIPNFIIEPKQEEPDTCQHEYCGFLCEEWLEKIDANINEIKEFAQYNKEFAMVMLGKAIERFYNARQDLPR